MGVCVTILGQWDTYDLVQTHHFSGPERVTTRRVNPHVPFRREWGIHFLQERLGLLVSQFHVPFVEGQVGSNLSGLSL